MAVIKYIIADDHKIFRQGLKFTLGEGNGLLCIGEAENGTQLLKLLKQQKPDAILLDLKMPGMDGLEITREVHRLYPDIRIIILSMFDDEPFILKLLETGACSYLTKDSDPEEIRNALKVSVENGFYFNQLVGATMLKKLVHKEEDPTPVASQVLSGKELEVLRLICKEYTTSEIGQKVFLSPRTVEGIRSGLLQKTGAKSIVGLVLYAVKNGLVEV